MYAYNYDIIIFLLYYYKLCCSHVVINLDDLCFDELSYEVVEGDRLDFDLVLSRRLPSSLSVTFKYYDVTAVVSKLFCYI